MTRIAASVRPIDAYAFDNLHSHILPLYRLCVVTVAMCSTKTRGPAAPDTLEKHDIKTERQPTSPSQLSEASPPAVSPVIDIPSEIPPVSYTVFTSFQKRILIIVLMLTMLASPLTATIYLPLLPSLAEHFDVSMQAINLTITIYIVFQAISPLLLATISDSLGRRPIYLFIYALFTLANLGLALNKRSYAGLLILRALQSFGASAVLAIAFGVVADVWPPAKRGSVLGPTQGAANLAVCIGPVLGGWIALASGGFQWVFWALTIFGVFVWLVVGMALPETARNVVGNGSSERREWERPWWEVIKKKRTKCKEATGSAVVELGAPQPTLEPPLNWTRNREISEGKRRMVKMLNPFAAIRIIFWKDTALVLWMAASPYAVWYCVQTSIPSIYKHTYHFSELQVGLAYLTGGAGTVLGGYANGKFMDWNYRVTAKQIGHIIDQISGDDLTRFPIERARARGGWYLLITYTCALVGYGWSVTRTSAAAPLILQFIIAALCTYFQQTFNALLVDIYPKSPGTAAAASNITRCALSAVAVTILQPLTDVIGRGWFFTSLAVLSGGGGMATIWAMMSYSMQWRQQRLSIMEAQNKK